MSIHACPDCRCERTYNLASSDRAKELVEQLTRSYGSVKKAGRAYSERYGLYVGRDGQSSGARLFERIRLYQASVTHDTLDRIEVFAAS